MQFDCLTDANDLCYHTRVNINAIAEWYPFPIQEMVIISSVYVSQWCQSLPQLLLLATLILHKIAEESVPVRSAVLIHGWCAFFELFISNASRLCSIVDGYLLEPRMSERLLRSYPLSWVIHEYFLQHVKELPIKFRVGWNSFLKYIRINRSIIKERTLHLTSSLLWHTFSNFEEYLRSDNRVSLCGWNNCIHQLALS